MAGFNFDNRLNQEYFSGAQGSLYIGDVWVDDVINYSFRVEHSRSPVYGYGSQHYDLMPKGTIIIMGEFTINFREPNYLWLILERYKKFNRNGRARTEQEAQQLLKTRTQKRIENNDKTFGEDNRANIDLFLNAQAQDARVIRDKMDETFENKGSQRKTREYWNHPSFSMVFGFGDANQDSIGDRLNGVQLMGKARAVQADGTPVQETYSFIGRDFR